MVILFILLNFPFFIFLLLGYCWMKKGNCNVSSSGPQNHSTCREWWFVTHRCYTRRPFTYESNGTDEWGKTHKWSTRLVGKYVVYCMYSSSCGHGMVHRSEDKEEYPGLGEWINDQRQNYQGTLSNRPLPLPLTQE